MLVLAAGAQEWRVAECLAGHNDVRCLALEATELWTGSPFGITRFERSSGRVLSRYGLLQGLADPRVACLARWGPELLAGTPAGLYRLVDGQFRRWGPAGRHVTALDASPQGLRVGTRQGLFRLEADEWVLESPEPVVDLRRDRAGQLWVLHDHRLVGPRPVPLPAMGQELYLGPQGPLVVVADHQVLGLDPEGRLLAQELDPLAWLRGIDSHSRLWMVAHDLPRDQLTPIGLKAGGRWIDARALPSGSVNRVEFDERGQAWILTARGLVADRGESFQVYADPAGPQARERVAFDGRGGLGFARGRNSEYPEGWEVDIRDGERWEQRRTGEISASCVDASQRLFVCTAGSLGPQRVGTGIQVWERGRWREFPSVPGVFRENGLLVRWACAGPTAAYFAADDGYSPLAGTGGAVLLACRDGAWSRLNLPRLTSLLAVCASRAGVFLFDGGRVYHRQTVDPLPGRTKPLWWEPLAFCCDDSGQLWLLDPDRLWGRASRGPWRHWGPPGGSPFTHLALGPGRRPFLSDAAGRLWSLQGVWREETLDRPGLRLDRLSWEGDTLWASSNAGLLRLVKVGRAR